MADKASSLIQKLLNRNSGNAPIPDIAQVAAKFVEKAGGPANLAELLWKEWLASDEGSPTRQKILDLVLRSMKGAESRIGEGSLSELTEAELENVLGELLQREDKHANATPPAGHGTVTPRPAQAGGAEEGPEADPDAEAGPEA